MSMSALEGKWWHHEPNIIIRSYCAIAEKVGLEILPVGLVLKDDVPYGWISWETGVIKPGSLGV